MKKALFLTTVASVFLLTTARLALAHALLVASTPTIHATVHGPALAVDLKFNSRVDGERSRVVLVLPNGETQTLSLLKQPAPEELTARVELTTGTYTLRWQAVATDGHITRGEIPFKVE